MRPMILVLVLVLTALAVPAGAGRAAPQKETIAIYQNGVPVTTVAPSSQIEVRGTGFNPNMLYFVGLVDGSGDGVIPAADGTFIVAATAPEAAGAYVYSARHFLGQSSHRVTDATTPLTVA